MFLYDNTRKKTLVEHPIKLQKESINKDKIRQKDDSYYVFSERPSTLKDLDNRVSLAALEIAKQLKSPSDMELTQKWQFSYGCGNLHDDDPESCKFKTLFNAASLDEALWMKRNGFPHRGMIDQLTDESSHDQIIELARNNYKPAVALAALVTNSLGMHDDAVRWAARFNTLSEPTDIYAHRLQGDIIAAQDPLNIYALQHYLIAQYLGDFESEVMVQQYWTGSDYHNNTADSYAREYILNHVGPPFDQQPFDPRPRPNGGG